MLRKSVLSVISVRDNNKGLCSKKRSVFSLFGDNSCHWNGVVI